MMDDAINVHGIYVKIVDIIDESTVGVEQIHFQQWGFDFAEPGDMVEFVDPDTLVSMGRAKVKNYRWLNESYQELEFEQPVKDIVKINQGIENVSWSAGMTFKNNIVEKNRARGILFSTRGKVLVEGNTFASMMAGISISGDVNFWFESGPSHDVTIRNNKFIDCTSGGKGNAVIMVAPIVKRPEQSQGYYHRNFTIENNTFEAFDKAIFYALSVDGLRFRNNKILHSGTYQPLFSDKPTLEIMGSRNVEISGNEFNEFHNGSIRTDEKTQAQILLKDNLNRTGEIRVQENPRNPYDVL